MGLHVSSQVGPVCKGLATMSTAVGFVSGMRTHVALQQPRTGEGLAAHVALMGQVVGEHVHGQGWHAHVHLVTYWALLGVVGVEGAMGLPMAREVAAGGVMLAAFCTGVFRFHIFLGHSRLRLL
jgi:hypothetical protein